MKKILCLVLTLAIALCATMVLAEEAAPAEEETVEIELMSHQEYAEAEIDAPVYVETYVQGSQAWWAKDGVGRMTLYLQSEDGAYFAYEVLMDEEASKLLVPGTKIGIWGYKAEWSGEVEIVDAEYEIIDGDPFIAEPFDATALLDSEELIDHQNEKVVFKGMTVEAYDESGAAFAYKNAEEKKDDIYLKVSKDGKSYAFCVEAYLCNEESDTYKAVEALKVGDVIDIEAFLYWYNGANPHITAVSAAQ